MARPKKKNIEKRDKRFQLRLTEAEHQTLQTALEQSGFSSMAEFARVTMLKRGASIVVNKGEYLKALRGLRGSEKKVGSNINQIAYAANRAWVASQTFPAVATYQALKDLLDQYSELHDQAIAVINRAMIDFRNG